MAGVLRNLGKEKPWLVVAATRKEFDAVIGGRQGMPSPVQARGWAVASFDSGAFHILESGVGKALGAAATSRVFDPERHGGVLSIGLAGALPGSGLELGDIVIATRMIFADEGSENPDGFRDIGAMGFGPMPDGSIGVAAEPGGIAALHHALAGARTGPIATVSTCSGTDARAAAIAARTGAIAEAMEGAAVALAAMRIAGGHAPVLEIRAISNTTGDRDRQRWDVKAAFGALTRIGNVL